MASTKRTTGAKKKSPAKKKSQNSAASDKAPRKPNPAADAASRQASASCYDRDALAFLVELGVNNDRDWFKANQERYEASVREPTLALIRSLKPRLHKLSPHLHVSDKKVGGSMMRPQRDTRFSSNKDPYKTNVGVHFRHVAGKDVHAPGCYFHFDPEGVWVAVGMWHPDSEPLSKVRQAIADKPQGYVQATRDKRFTQYFDLGGDSLKRPPKGYSAEHPMIDALRLKDHIAMSKLDAKAVYASNFVAEVDKRFQAAKPYMKYLCDALGLPF